MSPPEPPAAEPEPEPRTEAPALPPSEPEGPPPRPPTPAGRPFAGFLIPTVLGLGGAALIVVGILQPTGGPDRNLSDALRASGVADVRENPIPVVEVPPDTVADFTPDRSGIPTGTVPNSTATTEEWWPVAHLETFDSNDRGWPIGESEGTTRAFSDGTYRMSTSGRDSTVPIYTWQPGLGLGPEFAVSVEAAGRGGASCGLAIATASGYPRIVAMIDAAVGNYRVMMRETEGGEIENLIDWRESDMIRLDASNQIMLLRNPDEIWILINEIAVAKVGHFGIEFDQPGMNLRAPGGGESACTFDDLELRRP